jgi:hypothetical protein
MRPAAFLRVWLGATLAVLALVATFNALVDPYAVLGTPTIAGLTRLKPAAIARPTLAKPYAVERVRANTLLLGSSRVDAGLDPRDPAWPEALRPVFNLGLAGSGPDDFFRILQQALRVSRPKLVIVGIGLDDTLRVAPPPDAVATPQAGTAIDSLAARVRARPDGTPNGLYWRARLHDLVMSLFTLDATADSVSTLWRQRAGDVSAMTPLGYNTAADFVRWTRTDGPLGLFLAKDREKARRFLAAARAPAFDLGALGDMIDRASDAGAEVIVMVTPGHVDELELLRQAGLMPLREEWLRQIVAIAGAAGARPGAHVAVWDFSAPSQYTTESPTPRAGTNWFWESNHFKAALGGLMIRRMLGEDATGIGIRLDAGNVDAENETVASDLARYEASRPDDVARVTRIIDAARGHADSTDQAAGGTRAATIAATSMSP